MLGKVLLSSCALLSSMALAQTSTLPVLGYAKTSVNTVVFRGNSVVTFG